MTFIILLAILFETPIVAQGILAWEMKLFTRSQGKKNGTAKERFLPFIEHAGMWSDFVVISPMTAWMIVSFWTVWNPNTVLLVLTGSAVINLIPIFFWAKESTEEPSAWNVNGKVTPAGWIHYGYTVVAMTVIILFYFSTPREMISQRASAIVSGLLVVHVFLGFWCTEWITQKRIRPQAWIIVFALWTLILFGWLHISH